MILLCNRHEQKKKHRTHHYLGSAFRAIIYETRLVDGVIMEAANRAKIANIKSRLQAEVIMWVDPRQIQIQYSHSSKRVLIFDSTNEIQNGADFSRQKFVQEAEQIPQMPAVNV